MKKDEAIAFLKDYEIFVEIEAILKKCIDYSPGNRERRGAVQDTILQRLDKGSNNKLRNMITAVLKRNGILAIKYQGDRCYKNVRLRN